MTLDAGPGAIHPEGGQAARMAREYFRTVARILTRPQEFFRRLPLEGGVASPLAFALVTHWIGTAASFLVSQAITFRTEDLVRTYSHAIGSLFGSFSDEDIDRISRSAQYGSFRHALEGWLFGAGWVVANPFITMLWLLFTAAFIFLGARILVTPGDGSPGSSPREITFESAVRLIAYASTPSILAFLPLVGGAAAFLGTLVFSVIAAREIYRIGTGRALVVGLFPKVLLAGIIAMALIAAVFVFIHWL